MAVLLTNFETRLGGGDSSDESRHHHRDDPGRVQNRHRKLLEEVTTDPDTGVRQYHYRAKLPDAQIDRRLPAEQLINMTSHPKLVRFGGSGFDQPKQRKSERRVRFNMVPDAQPTLEWMERRELQENNAAIAAAKQANPTTVRGFDRAGPTPGFDGLQPVPIDVERTTYHIQSAAYEGTRTHNGAPAESRVGKRAVEGRALKPNRYTNAPAPSLSTTPRGAVGPREVNLNTRRATVVNDRPGSNITNPIETLYNTLKTVLLRGPKKNLGPISRHEAEPMLFSTRAPTVSMTRHGSAWAGVQRGRTKPVIPIPRQGKAAKYIAVAAKDSVPRDHSAAEAPLFTDQPIRRGISPAPRPGGHMSSPSPLAYGVDAIPTLPTVPSQRLPTHRGAGVLATSPAMQVHLHREELDARDAVVTRRKPAMEFASGRLGTASSSVRDGEHMFEQETRPGRAELTNIMPHAATNE